MNISMVARIIVIAFILLGILNQPYEYYVFLRIFVAIVALFLTIIAFKKVHKTGFDYVYGLIAILYNPVLPIYAPKETWVVLNMITIIILGISLAIDKGEFRFEQLINKNTTHNKTTNTSSQQDQHKKWIIITILASVLALIVIYFEQFNKEDKYLIEPYFDEYNDDQHVFEDEDYEEGIYEDEIRSDYHNSDSYEEYELDNEYKDHQTTTFDDLHIDKTEGYYGYSDIESIEEYDFNATKTDGYFTIGSTQNEVKEIMGTPTNIYTSLNKWNYDYSSIDFNESGIVVGWHDLSNILKVNINKTTESTSFTLGSTKQDVVNAMGTPTAIYNSLNKWNYDYSSVDFNENGIVVGWHDLSNILKVNINITTENTSFTLGSTKQDVVNAMGTPTAIYSSLNKWNYEYSSVDFDQNDKVISWNDLSNNLNVN